MNAHTFSCSACQEAKLFIFLFFKNPFFISAWCLSDARSNGTSPWHPPLTHRPQPACGNTGLTWGGLLAPRTQVLPPMMPYCLPPDVSNMAALMPAEASQCLFLCTECLSGTHLSTYLSCLPCPTLGTDPGTQHTHWSETTGPHGRRQLQMFLQCPSL